MSYRIVVMMKAQVFYVLCVGVLCLLKSAAAAAAAAADAAVSGRDYAAKLGVCPNRRLEEGLGLCADFCTKDRDCPGNEKCCSNGCGRQCTPPQKDIAKPGVCPSTRFGVGVCAEFCSNDSNCPGNDKCCSNGCGHQCTPPQKDIVKPGVCPRRRFEVGVRPGVCAELCDNDSNCPGNEKCCSNGCGHQCTPPQTDIAKPGVCPSTRFGVGVCAEFCDNDSNCPGNDKCCSNGCGHQCTPPQKDIVKPGVCPRRRFEVEVRPGVCAELCDNDSNCPGNEKCCSNRCGQQCTPPQNVIDPRGARAPGYLKETRRSSKAKRGVCPRRRFRVAVCAELCANDRDCPGNEKCCSTGCGHQCSPPYKAKPGVCPSRRFGVGVCAELCANDTDCPGNDKCCSNGCGHQCTPPYTVKPRLCTLWMWTPMCPQ